jgi:hypothetical protein
MLQRQMSGSKLCCFQICNSETVYLTAGKYEPSYRTKLLNFYVEKSIFSRKMTKTSLKFKSNLNVQKRLGHFDGFIDVFEDEKMMLLTTF